MLYFSQACNVESGESDETRLFVVARMVVVVGLNGFSIFGSVFRLLLLGGEGRGLGGLEMVSPVKRSPPWLRVWRRKGVDMVRMRGMCWFGRKDMLVRG